MGATVILLQVFAGGELRALMDPADSASPITW